MGYDLRHGFGAYVVSMSGGEPERVVGDGGLPAWSPDGTKLVLRELFQMLIRQEPGKELKSARSTFSPERSMLFLIPARRLALYWPKPDTLVTGSEDGSLVAFDLKTQKWSVLAPGDIDNWFPSADGEYMYFERGAGPTRKAFRIRLADRHTETVADLTGIKRAEDRHGTWLGVTPDGFVLITRDIGTQEIYALDVKWP